MHTVCVCVYARASVCGSINALFVAGFVVDLISIVYISTIRNLIAFLSYCSFSVLLDEELESLGGRNSDN